MSRRNEGKTSSSKLKSYRERYLEDSESKLNQLEKILEILKEAGVEHDLVRKLYDRELARKARLTKLVEEGE